MNKELISIEIQQLPSENKLLTFNTLTVYIAEASQIPHIMQEIGLLRIGAFDLGPDEEQLTLKIDAFDFYYSHLFVMDNETHQILGAYRLGFVDKILQRFGKKGLYVSTLYTLADNFFQKTGPLIELGLAFISPENQGRAPVLQLMLKAILLLVKQRQYAGVYGLTSITNDYKPESKQLIVDSLRVHCSDEILSSLVSPLHPYQNIQPSSEVHVLVNDKNWVITLEKMIRSMESNQRGLPVLLRHYLGTQPKIITFGWDPHFKQVLDCFTLVLVKNMPAYQLDRILSVKSILDKYQ